MLKVGKILVALLILSLMLSSTNGLNTIQQTTTKENSITLNQFSSDLKDRIAALGSLINVTAQNFNNDGSVDSFITANNGTGAITGTGTTLDPFVFDGFNFSDASSLMLYFRSAVTYAIELTHSLIYNSQSYGTSLAFDSSSSPFFSMTNCVIASGLISVFNGNTFNMTNNYFGTVSDELSSKLSVGSAQHLIVENNTFIGTSTSMGISSVNSYQISKNTVMTGFGITINYGTSSTLNNVTNNYVVTDSSPALILGGTDNVNVAGNYFDTNSGETGLVYNTVGTMFTNNSISGVGISFKEQPSAFGNNTMNGEPIQIIRDSHNDPFNPVEFDLTDVKNQIFVFNSTGIVLKNLNSKFVAGSIYIFNSSSIEVEQVSILQNQIYGIVVIDSFDVVIHNVYIEDVKQDFLDGYGIYMDNANQTVISNSSFTGPLTQVGLYLSNCYNQTISGNYFSQATSIGLYVEYSVKDNSSSLDVEYNKFTYLETAIEIINADHYTQQFNQFYFNQNPISIESSTNVILQSEIIRHNYGWAVNLWDTTNATVSDSQVSGGQIGVYVASSKNIDIGTITVSGSQRALSIKDSDNLSVTHSDFDSSIADNYIIDNVNATFSFNYYSDYSGSGSFNLTDTHSDASPSTTPNNAKKVLEITSSGNQFIENSTVVGQITWELSHKYLFSYSIMDQSGNIIAEGRETTDTINYTPSFSTPGNYSFTLVISNLDGETTINTVLVVVHTIEQPQVTVITVPGEQNQGLSTFTAVTLTFLATLGLGAIAVFVFTRSRN